MIKRESAMNYALNVLYKHRATLESNLTCTPAIQIPVKMLPVYRQQLREVRNAIVYLEKAESERNWKSDTVNG